MSIAPEHPPARRWTQPSTTAHSFEWGSAGAGEAGPGRTEGKMDAPQSSDRGDRGPMDPTRKLLKVFGVKVTDYEAKTDELVGRWAAADASGRAAIQAEAL